MDPRQLPPVGDQQGQPTAVAGDRRTFLRRVLIVVGIVAAAVAVALAVCLYVRVLLLAFGGFLFSVLLYTVSSWVARHTRLGYRAALTLTCVVLVGLLVAAGWLVGDRVSSQVGELRQRLPEVRERAHSYLAGRHWGQVVLSGLDDALDSAGNWAASSGPKVVGTTSRVLGELAVLLFVGLFGAVDPDLYLRGFLRILPARHEHTARELAGELRVLLWYWLVGQLVAMAFIGVVTALVVWAFGLPLALTLGLIAALLNFIPNFGPFLAALPAVGLALLKTPATALWVALCYTAIQVLQNNFLTPLVQKRVVHLPPAVMILSQIFLFYWAGALGMVFAPPLALVAMTLIERLYVQGTLGKPA